MVDRVTRKHARRAPISRVSSRMPLVVVRSQARSRHSTALTGLILGLSALMLSQTVPLLPQVTAAVSGASGHGTEEEPTPAPTGSGIALVQPPVPGITPSPEPEPTHFAPEGISIPATSSSRVLNSVQGVQLIPGYRAVSFRLAVNVGSDFATRIDRSIRLWGPDDIRYLADEAEVEPSLVNAQGSALDGWVTFLLPNDMTGPASIHITIDPKALTEIVIPVVIGGGKTQPAGDHVPTSIEAFDAATAGRD